MRIFLVTLLLSGCGSACSTTPEPALDPASAADLPQTPPNAVQQATPSPVAEPEPPPPPKPLDAEDERVVYISPSDRTKVRFVARDEQLLVANFVDETEMTEQLSLQDLHGRTAWQHRYGRIDGIALDAEAAYALADGHLYRYALDSGEPQDMGEAKGQLVLTDRYVYVQDGGVVRRAKRPDGALEKVTKHEHGPGFHHIAVGNGELAMLAGAFRNRPARLPKPSSIWVMPEKGGKLKERFGGMYTAGPDLCIDSGYVYVGASRSADDFQYRILRMPLKGNTTVEAVVNHPIAVFAVDDGRVYAAAWLNEKPGLYLFPKGEGEPVLLSEFDGGASEVSLSEGYVYWESRGRIYRVPKAARAQPEPAAVAEPAEAASEPPTPATQAAAKKPSTASSAGNAASPKKAAPARPAPPAQPAPPTSASSEAPAP